MKKFELSSCYVISKFKYHNELKNELLELIDKAEYEHVVQPNAEVDITKTDWFLAKNADRPWVKILHDRLIEQMKEIYSFMGYDDFILDDLWFQQYQKSSGHGWHAHGSTFTNVYYLELPKETPKTEMISPFDQTSKFQFDVEEGDILAFPSYVLHRAPVNTSNVRKTIISYNTQLCYTDSQYGRNLSY